MGKFNKGLVVGGLVGAGLMWLNSSKKGKEMRAQIMDAAHEVYEGSKEKVMTSETWQHMTKTKYAQIVATLVDDYATKQKLSPKTKSMVKKLVNAQYARLKKEMAARSSKKKS